MDTNQLTIGRDPAGLDGKPVVNVTRLPVEHRSGLMAGGWSKAEILTDHPGLTHADAVACLAPARDLLQAGHVSASSRMNPRARGDQS